MVVGSIYNIYQEFSSVFQALVQVQGSYHQAKTEDTPERRATHALTGN